MNGAFDSPEHRRWERACLTRAKAGDRAAFAELYRKFADPLMGRILMPRLGNRQAAEDALSETFRTLLERLDGFEDQGVSLWHWLSKVAVNKATDLHRVKGRTKRALVNFEGLMAPLRESSAGRPDGAVEQASEMDRLRATVTTTLAALNPRYRLAIELRFIQERSREQCAETLEVKLGTFDVLLLRALRAFRREWESAREGARVEQEATGE
jgi:RNA polymerase sigma-70 factor (ECF subfamily)